MHALMSSKVKCWCYYQGCYTFYPHLFIHLLTAYLKTDLHLLYQSPIKFVQWICKYASEDGELEYVAVSDAHPIGHMIWHLYHLICHYWSWEIRRGTFWEAKTSGTVRNDNTCWPPGGLCRSRRSPSVRQWRIMADTCIHQQTSEVFQSSTTRRAESGSDMARHRVPQELPCTAAWFFQSDTYNRVQVMNRKWYYFCEQDSPF